MRAPIDNFDAQDFPKGSVSQKFGENPALYNLHVGLRGHNGIDIVAYKGCPLVAVEDGEIVNVKTDPKGYGRHVRLLSEDREWTYGHCEKILVTVGQKVKEGDVIATMGNSGFVVSQATAKMWWGDAPDDQGTHCHFGLRLMKRDPQGWVYPGSTTKLTAVNYDNGYKGSIDPLPFLMIPVLQRLVKLLTELIKLR